jgi:hypothetical protein
MRAEGKIKRWVREREGEMERRGEEEREIKNQRLPTYFPLLAELLL